MGKSICLAAGILFLFGCATTTTGDKHGGAAVLRLIAAINRDAADSVVNKIRYPFLLDTEIIVTEEDIKSFWTDYIKAGFAIEDPRVLEIRKIGEADYGEFGKSMDIKLFFKKYIPQKGYLIKIGSWDMVHYFIIVAGKDEIPVFCGYKGSLL